MNPKEFFDKATFVEPTESADRNYVVTKAVAIEKYISLYLSYTLGIENYEDSTSFGKKSGALSFISKVHLFSDLGIVESPEKTKLITFAEIRNRFAHNEECSTYETAYTEEHIKRLNKYYGKDLSYKEQFDRLYEDIKLILEKVKKEIYNTKVLKLLSKAQMQIHNILVDNLRSNALHFNQAALKKIMDEATAHVTAEDGMQDVIMMDIFVDFDKAFK